MLISNHSPCICTTFHVLFWLMSGIWEPENLWKKHIFSNWFIPRHLDRPWESLDTLPKCNSEFSPEKLPKPNRERAESIVFQPSFFRGELLNFGGVHIQGPFWIRWKKAGFLTASTMYDSNPVIYLPLRWFTNGFMSWESKGTNTSKNTMPRFLQKIAAEK